MQYKVYRRKAAEILTFKYQISELKKKKFMLS
jgi:hypothetical protein